MFTMIEVAQAMLVIFPEGTRSEGATLYPADRTRSSQEHQKDNDSKVETNANKVRSRGNEAMAEPSSGSSHCSKGDESVYSFTEKETNDEEEDPTSTKPADDVPDREGDTKAGATTTLRSSTDESTTSTLCSSTNDSTTSTLCSSTDKSITSRISSSMDESRPCSNLQHLLASATRSPFITEVLNDEDREDVTDSDAEILNGDMDDDGVGAATEPHNVPISSHVLVRPLATRGQAQEPCSFIIPVKT